MAVSWFASSLPLDLGSCRLLVWRNRRSCSGDLLRAAVVVLVIGLGGVRKSAPLNNLHNPTGSAPYPLSLWDLGEEAMPVDLCHFLFNKFPWCFLVFHDPALDQKIPFSRCGSVGVLAKMMNSNQLESWADSVVPCKKLQLKPFLAQVKKSCRLRGFCAINLDAYRMDLVGFGLVHAWLSILWRQSWTIAVMLCRSLVCTVIGSAYDLSWFWYPSPFQGVSLCLMEPVVFIFQQYGSPCWKFLESCDCALFSFLDVIQDEGAISVLFGIGQRLMTMPPPPILRFNRGDPQSVTYLQLNTSKTLVQTPESSPEEPPGEHQLVCSTLEALGDWRCSIFESELSSDKRWLVGSIFDLQRLLLERTYML